MTDTGELAPQTLLEAGALIAEQSPFGVVALGTDLRYVFANPAAERLIGMPADRIADRRLGELAAATELDVFEQPLRQVLASGKPATLEHRFHVDGCTGGERICRFDLHRLEGTGGDILGVAVTIIDITDRVRSRERLALLDKASTRIGTTLDINRTAEELLEVAIPGLADAGAVNLLRTVLDGNRLSATARGEPLQLRKAAVRWAPPRAAPEEYVRHQLAMPDPAKEFHRKMVAGFPIYLPHFGTMSRRDLRRMDSGYGLGWVRAAQRAGAHSLIMCPLFARGVIMGVAVFYRLDGSAPFTPEDLSLLRDLADRAAIYIDNARHYTRERATALTLQRALLPRCIPDVPGLTLAYRYAPAQTAAEAGGDWFDVIPLTAGRTALIVGDVSGHDIHAASLMGQLRTATHTLTTLNLTPADILTRLDQITADLTCDDEAIATCLCAVYNPTTGHATIARAGHPPPTITHPDGTVTFPDTPPGLPLGVGGARYRNVSLPLPPSATLVLYTDGLIETREADICTGLTRLAETLHRTPALTPDDAATAILTTLAPHPSDDIAILLARTHQSQRARSGGAVDHE